MHFPTVAIMLHRQAGERQAAGFTENVEETIVADNRILRTAFGADLDVTDNRDRFAVIAMNFRRRTGRNSRARCQTASSTSSSAITEPPSLVTASMSASLTWASTRTSP